MGSLKTASCIILILMCRYVSIIRRYVSILGCISHMLAYPMVAKIGMEIKV